MSSPVMHRQFQMYRYGIVDANLRDELPQTWAQRVIAPSFLGKDTGRCPVLVDVGSLPEEATGELLDRLESETAGRLDTVFSLLLKSDVSLTSVSHHLARRMVVQLEAQRRPMQLRYFDPGTFLQLPLIFGDKGMNWLLGLVTSVMIPWAGEWHRYEKPDAEGKNFSLAPTLPALLDIGAVNRAAMQLAPPANQQGWVDRCVRIRGHIRRARESYQLTARDDLIAFALHAENCHPRFDEHKIIRAVMAELAGAKEEDQLDYRELTSRLDSNVWARIERDLTENNSMGEMSS